MGSEEDIVVVEASKRCTVTCMKGSPPPILLLTHIHTHARTHTHTHTHARTHTHTQDAAESAHAGEQSRLSDIFPHIQQWIPLTN
jgi:ABC-type nickel/cobalt efflux system permease component RcnA